MKCLPAMGKWQQASGDGRFHLRVVKRITEQTYETCVSEHAKNVWKGWYENDR